MGWDGWDGSSKWSFNFFNFRYIKLYTYANLYIRKCPDKFLVFLKLWASWGPHKEIQKHPLGGIFLKSVRK